MSNLKLIIIVPVYNCAPFIDRCVQSLVNQTYSNINIILINDGSNDSSFEFCKKWSLLDSRIILINKSNEGVSKTRNIGIEKAIELGADLVGFVDADDYIDKDMYYNMINQLVYNKADLSICSRVRELDNSTITYLGEEDCILNGFINLNKLACEYDLHSSINKVYSISFFQSGIRFPEGMAYGEDLCFVIDILKESKKAIYIPTGYYHYVENKSSASFNWNEKKLKEGIICYRKLFDFFVEKGISARPALNNIFGAYARAYQKGNKSQFLKDYRFFFIKNIKYCYKFMKYWLFFIHPPLYFVLKR